MPAAVTHTTTDTTATTLRRSSRNRKPHSMAKAGASQISTLELEEVDVGSLDAAHAEDVESEAEDDILAADDSDLESDAEDSEAETSELRDDLGSNGEEATENDDDSRDSASPNTDIVDNFIQYCWKHQLERDQDLTEEEEKSVQLMDLLRKSKAPLGSFQPMLEWHLKETGDLKHWQTIKDTPNYVTRETLMKRLSKRYNCEAMKPKIKKVRLPFSKSVAHIPVRDAKDAILSLLTDPRIQDDDYLFFDDDPLAPPPVNVKFLEDLNTGDAYLKTFEKMIEEKGEVLLPVPMYIDGAVTGQFSDLPLTPVKLALGIHKRETRDKDYAWREIGWIPQIRKQKARGKKLFKESRHLEARDLTMVDGEGDNQEVLDPEARDERKAGDEDEENEVPAQDFHTMLSVILESFVELQRTGFVWDLVYKGKLYKNIKFKIRTRTVKHICRYCHRHCPTDEADDPRVKHKKKKPGPIQKLVDKQDLEALRDISQQCIQNAWCEVGFHQAKDSGIHGACPSEMLHAILLGVVKYVS